MLDSKILKRILSIMLFLFFTACGGNTSTTNQAPTVNAGSDQTITLGETINLQGSATDADGDTLTYQWMTSNKPQDSNATIPNSTQLNTSFIPDVAGSYTISLEVNDGTTKITDSLTVTVNTSSNPEPNPDPQPSQKIDYANATKDWPNWDTFATQQGVNQPDEDRKTGPTSDPEDISIIDDSGKTVNYSCTTTPYRLTTSPDKIVTLQPDTGVLWVGSLIQGNGYTKGLGSLRELPIRQRAPMAISINLLTENNTKVVENPTVATVTQAIGELVDAAEKAGFKSGSNISYREEKASSFVEAMLSVDVSYKYLTSSVEAGLDFSTKANETTYVGHFVQNMFTVTMVRPQTPSDFFSSELTPEIFNEQVRLGNIGADNIPVYVSSITYGRVMTFTITSTANETDLKAALKGSYSGFELDSEGKYKEILNNAKINIATVGGEDSDALSAIRSGDVKKYFEASASLTTAKPISYELRNVGEDSIAKVSETTDYKITECEATTDPVTEVFEWEEWPDVFRGPSSVPPEVEWEIPASQPRRVITGIGARAIDSNLVALRFYLADIQDDNTLKPVAPVTVGPRADICCDAEVQASGRQDIVVGAGFGYRDSADKLTNIILFTRELDVENGTLSSANKSISVPENSIGELNYEPDPNAGQIILTGLGFDIRSEDVRTIKFARGIRKE